MNAALRIQERRQMFLGKCVTRGLRNPPHRARGIATIEFAICAPLLIFLLLATAEVGRLLFQYNALAKAVRDGGRYVASASADTTRVPNITNTVRTQTQNLVVTGNSAGTGGPILPGLTSGDVNVQVVSNVFVSVSATYDYQPMLGASLPTFGLGDPIDLEIPLTATVVMRVL